MQEKTEMGTLLAMIDSIVVEMSYLFQPPLVGAQPLS